ncbi:MAG: SusD/RagB family nutrient-binding outer membrane lipoprotein [Tannerellaceae bacterium]|jgi:hypothetical protein|nr:SusD/RagB family nutrient-binding outer membrane lipoprotein [Tannerellaceae bacterium]
MNKHIFSIVCLATALFTFSNCSESDYTDKYTDPSKTTDVSCEKLMTGVFYAAKTYTTPEYWRVFTFDYYLLGRCAQTVGFINSPGRYAGGGESYINDRWTNFYHTLTQFRLLEYTYDNLSEANKPDYEVFVLLAKVMVYEQLEEVIDLWGDVPYSKAGYLAITGDVKSSYPSYDKAETLYEMMLGDLQVINSKLAGLTPSSLATTYLSAQDYINKGDLLKWRKFTNSLRLRMAMRVADKGSLTDKGRAILREMLGDPSTYPLVDNNNETIKINSDTDAFKVTGDTNTGIQGIESWNGQMNRASQAMINALNGDPRLEIIYEPNSAGEYVGLDTHDDENTQQTLFDRLEPDGGNYYSAIDTGTFSRNAQYPGILMTASEVSFIRAEACQKGYAQGDVREAFEKGVCQSVELYYSLNSTSTYREPVPAPAVSDIAAFAAQKWESYKSAEVAIATQKWLHFGLIQILEAWNEVRRTGLPELYFPVDNNSPAYPKVFEKLRYPSDERNNNQANYATVQAQDSYYIKLFWAK